MTYCLQPGRCDVLYSCLSVLLTCKGVQGVLRPKSGHIANRTQMFMTRSATVSGRLTFTAEFESQWPARKANLAPDRAGLTFRQSRLEWDHSLDKTRAGKYPSQITSSLSFAFGRSFCPDVGAHLRVSLRSRRTMSLTTVHSHPKRPGCRL